MTGEGTAGISLGELARELTRLARSPGYKVLSCARDVADAIAEAVPPAAPRGSPDFSGAGVIRDLLAVIIVVTPDSAPGTFRLAWHYDPDRRAATCEVRDDRVWHDRCRVVLEGRLGMTGQEAGEA